MSGCGLDCGFAGRRLFLSSKLFTGDMGSRAGADLACQVMAEDAKFSQPDRFRALLADSLGSPNTWLANDASGLPFIAPSGLILADSYAALIDLGPGWGIHVTETGDMLVEERVWTNVGPFGDAYLLDPDHTCVDWTSDDPAKSARVGRNAVAPADFTQWQDERHWLTYATQACTDAWRVYCVEVL